MANWIWFRKACCPVVIVCYAEKGFLLRAHGSSQPAIMARITTLLIAASVFAALLQDCYGQYYGQGRVPAGETCYEDTPRVKAVACVSGYECEEYKPYGYDARTCQKKPNDDDDEVRTSPPEADVAMWSGFTRTWLPRVSRARRC